MNKLLLGKSNLLNLMLILSRGGTKTAENMKHKSILTRICSTDSLTDVIQNQS